MARIHHAVPPLLCVDDESSNLATLRQLLRDDFALVFAKSGGDALDAVTRHTPKLILLDVELPDMDGYAVARALKQQPSSNAIPILFVSSRNSEHDERLGLEAGAADYVSKPYSPTLLKARIATQLKLAENVRLAQQYRDAIHLLGTAGRGQDANTGAHIWRMAVYARVLAEAVGWSPQQAQTLQDAAPLHDAGKIAVPGSILQKPDSLDEHERSMVRQHPQAGHDLLRHGRGAIFQLAAEIALHHHECWDGSGYPEGVVRRCHSRIGTHRGGGRRVRRAVRAARLQGAMDRGRRHAQARQHGRQTIGTAAGAAFP